MRSSHEVYESNDDNRVAYTHTDKYLYLSLTLLPHLQVCSSVRRAVLPGLVEQEGVLRQHLLRQEHLESLLRDVAAELNNAM